MQKNNSKSRINISKKTTYVPHNIELGTSTEQNGILLYGINSSGKSTLMKSIGLNIITLHQLHLNIILIILYLLV
jgi:ABC-type Mn2+/Zn2+ transport system ATPase subunit